ncbi:MAG: hypothetical protein ACOY82_17120 [Pseudomonadota bacterium]
MLIPTYWAEARLQHRQGRRTITLRRFGWSDVGEAEALAHAEARVREAMDRTLAGETLPRRERRVAYNGAEGVPIREELVERHDDCAITRTGYGALCLNTPDVLFADIDHAIRHDPSRWPRWRALTGLAIAAATIAIGDPGPVKYVLALLLGIGGGFVFGGAVAALAAWLRIKLTGGFERHAQRRIDRFVAAHPDWRLHVYRTPLGLRLMATHRRFDPRSPEVRACFDALGVDPLYARMCFNQDCFRARVSPKPWRMGMPRLHPPYSSAWRPEHAALPARRAWVETYAREARGYAACRHVAVYGEGREDPEIEALRGLHDLMCQADSDLPLA